MESEQITCAQCGATFDPADLDAVLYHELMPHRPIRGTGIVGERVREVVISAGEYAMLKRVHERSPDPAFALFLHRLAWELFGRDTADREWPGVYVPPEPRPKQL